MLCWKNADNLMNDTGIHTDGGVDNPASLRNDGPAASKKVTGPLAIGSPFAWAPISWFYHPCVLWIILMMVVIIILWTEVAYTPSAR